MADISSWAKMVELCGVCEIIMMDLCNRMLNGTPESGIFPTSRFPGALCSRNHPRRKLVDSLWRWATVLLGNVNIGFHDCGLYTWGWQCIFLKSGNIEVGCSKWHLGSVVYVEEL